MNPKEKAKELVDKYFNYLVTNVSDNYYIYESHGIDCAKFAVEEIIKSSPSAPILSDAGNFVNDIEESTEYWNEVLKEIDLLKEIDNL